MATNFPTSLDTLTNPTSSDSLSSPSHSAQHTNVNDAVEALQAKVGADSSAVTSSHDYLIADHASRLTTLEGAAGGKILQVVSTTKTDTYSASISATSEDSSNITGFEATITPSSTSNKILVMLSYSGCRSGGAAITAGTLYRDSTAVGIGDTAASRSTISLSSRGDLTDALHSVSFQFLDSPATTSAITYGWRLFNSSGSARTMYVNRDEADGTGSGNMRTAATITVMEVSA